ncbi:phosphate acyltransferase PlsX [Lysinibacillus pakistanensis]|uniref:Phosphate acyltransferase n=1 Tax=Lysinibacillus pakistanensis TaxID=759811 RepID=A0AAX3WYJ1_9BACI|nr:phosphate acyltransferase PlsX [Lysinibacillus pakistanensis]MDM5232197.1 phosphate acyltransferase PlsX [Lysinibacillus pakistanensis]WHY47715.1 phosphate acyltransferase PlsX [Lysinibacillus pakistanensis]WHY52727.1 phosphate acyltransferase PlsX [Lysinibacillus pakistanensis]
MKLALDGMGGDNAPKSVVEGALLALEQIPNLEIQLYGQQEKLEPFLKIHDRLTVIHCEEVVEGTDDPARAVRRKKDSSMAKIMDAVEIGKADACLSAGNTGALMAGGLFKVGRIEGIARPALATTLPTLDGKGFLMLDLGANADARPEHLLQYAIMGDIYAKKVGGLQKPRISLLNIGTEDKKGNELTKAAFELLKEADLNFIGNVEARDLLEGVADVVVTDGFTGNMVLKSIEGTAGALFSMLKEAFMSSTKTKISAALMKNNLRDLKNKMDYTEYGGAALFGLQAPVIKAHGSSNAKAIYSAIRQASTMVEHTVISTITETVRHLEID